MAHDAAGGVARVHDQLGAVNDGHVVVDGMVGGDDHGIVARERLRIQGNGLHVLVIVVAHFVELREVGIVVIERGTALHEELHDFERRGFAQIVHVFFVSHAQDQDFRAFHAFFVIVESVGGSFGDVVRHGGVDLAG